MGRDYITKPKPPKERITVAEAIEKIDRYFEGAKKPKDFRDKPKQKGRKWEL